MKKKILSLVLCLTMLVSMLPANMLPVFAATESGGTVSRLFNTHYDFYEDRDDFSATLLGKIREDGVTEVPQEAITAVHFVDLSEKPDDALTSDYSLNGDGSVLAWMGGADGTELYIGGNGTIIAGESFSGAFAEGYGVNEITGISMIDTSAVTDMAYTFFYTGQYSLELTLDLGDNFNTSNVTDMTAMFAGAGHNSTVFTLDLGPNFDTSKVTSMHRMFNTCGYASDVFTLDLGDKFDTSNVTSMFGMFYECGYSSEVFTLDLGDKFNTAKVTTMEEMFYYCGQSSSAFTTLDVSSFTVTNKTTLTKFAQNVPATTIILGDGWTNADWPTPGSSYGAFYIREKVSGVDIATTIAGAPRSLLTYNWAADNRTPTFDGYYKITLIAEEGGTVSGGGYGKPGDEVEVKAVPDEGYVFDGWYYNNMKVRSEAEFTARFYDEDDTYTAKFIKEEVPVVSKLFNTFFSRSEGYVTLLTKIYNDGVTTLEKNDMTAVHFVDLSEKPEGVATSDYSLDGDGSVLAWMGGEDGTELYIGGNGTIIAGESLRYAFYCGYGINEITGLSMLDTSNVTDMGYMFYSCGEESSVFTLDLGNNFDTSNVTDMESMFYHCGSSSDAFTLDLGDNFNTSNVTDMKEMFYYCGDSSSVFTLDLGSNFDTSKVTSMYRMFNGCGYFCEVFTLDLGDNFNTSNVTDMEEMFYYCGYNSPVFTLDLGDKFDTSNVTNMKGMFSRCCEEGLSFTLDLGDKFDTSNVTDMSFMFYACGDSSDVFTLDLGDKFNTAKVTTMEDMFYFCGRSSDIFTLDLGDKFDTAKVTTMEKMFYFCGRSSSAFTTLDLSGFTVGSETNLNNLAEKIPVTTFIFGEGWANATLPESNLFLASASEPIPTTVIGATPNLVAYDWESDNRPATIEGYVNITIDTTDMVGGTVSGGGYIAEGGSVTLTATPDEGYVFAGWYEGETKVSDSAEFVIEGVNADKTYTAKFKDPTVVVSKLFNTYRSTSSDNSTLLSKIYNDGVTTTSHKGITAVHFVDLSEKPEGVATSDYSLDGDGSVLAWMGGTDNRELYIGGNGTIIAGESLGGAFYKGENINAITGFSMLDTSNVTDMGGMFNECGRNSDVFTLDLGDNFDTSNVTDMGGMFNECGRSSSVFTLDLGDKFDTSNVTDMGGMFIDCGRNSDVFTLDLGDKFDTSNVTDMSSMFYGCGNSADVFNLCFDDKFDTSNVTDMSLMFYDCAKNAEVFTLDLGNNFDTSNVTNMDRMFYNCGYSSPVFTLDLGDKFNTAKNRNLGQMFSHCGKNSTEFTTLDLSGFVANYEINTAGFAYDTPVSTIIFGEGWAYDGKDFEGTYFSDFYSITTIPTTIINATPSVLEHDWEKDNRPATIVGYKKVAVDTTDMVGGTVTGDGYIANSNYIADGGSVTLTATPDDGYTFAGWYEGETKVSSDAEFVIEGVSADKTYTAKFEAIPVEVVTYAITISVQEGGTVAGGGEYEEGASATLKAVANEGYTFAGWYEGDVLVSSEADFVIENVTADKTYIAKFNRESLKADESTDNPEGGSTNEKEPAQVVIPEGEDEAVIEPNVSGGSGSYLYQWYKDGTEIPGATQPTLSVTEPGNYMVKVTDSVTGEIIYVYWIIVKAQPATYTITTIAEEGGTVPGTIDVVAGESVTIIAKANEGYTFAGWYEGGKKVSDSADFVIESVTENKTYTAKFEAIPVVVVKYVITGFAAEGGTVSGGGEVEEGGSIALEAEANEGYTFTGWYDGSLKVSDDLKFIVENVTANKTYTAKFTKDETTEPTDPTDPDNPDNPDTPVEPGTKNPDITVNGGNLVLNANGNTVTRVSIAYIGTEAKAISTWGQFEAAGKLYPEINTATGCRHYSNPADGKKWAMKDAGYYAVYVKADGMSTIYVVREVVYPEVVAENGKIKLITNGNNVTRVSIAYIGTEEKAISTWSQFETAGKAYATVNGSAGCKHYSSPANGKSWSVKNSGYYAVYVKADGFSTAYTVLGIDLPTVELEDGLLVFKANGIKATRVSLAYIGTENKPITTWDQFETAGKAFPEINDARGCKHYNNPEDGQKWKPEQTGYYAAYIKADGYSTVYSVVKVNETIKDPVITASGDKATLAANGNGITRVSFAYIGSEDKTIKTWSQFETAGKKYTAINGSAGCKHYSDITDGEAWSLENTGYYAYYIKAENGIAYYGTVKIEARPTNPVISVVENGSAALTTNDYPVSRVSVAYIGTEAKEIKSWSQFETAGKTYLDINGKNGCKHYSSPAEGREWAMDKEGYYAFYVRYTSSTGTAKTVYYVINSGAAAE